MTKMLSALLSHAWLIMTWRHDGRGLPPDNSPVTGLLAILSIAACATAALLSGGDVLLEVLIACSGILILRAVIDGMVAPLAITCIIYYLTKSVSLTLEIGPFLSYIALASGIVGLNLLIFSREEK